jgi:site-specific DNA recombinase
MEPRAARAILYCRSRREQAERGLANQERHLRRYAAEQGLAIVGVESDALGVKEDERPGLQRLLARAEQHEFDVLLVRNTARLARDARALELLRARLAAHGVRIISLASGETDA